MERVEGTREVRRSEVAECTGTHRGRKLIWGTVFVAVNGVGGIVI